MSRFINKILREVDNSPDDFFQSKHIKRRKEQFKKSEDMKLRESKIALEKLRSGMRKILISYRNKDWESEEEEMFVKLFSMLNVDNKFYSYDYGDIIDSDYGYYLETINGNYRQACFYCINKKRFWMSFDLIWNHFAIKFDMDDDDIQLFMNSMLKKYFNLSNIESHTVRR